jgi:hypothetical protein
MDGNLLVPYQMQHAGREWLVHAGNSETDNHESRVLQPLDKAGQLIDWLIVASKETIWKLLFHPLVCS